MANSFTSLPPFHNANDPLPQLVEKKPVDDAIAVVVRALEAGLPKRFAAHLAGYSYGWLHSKCHEDPEFKMLIDKATAVGVEVRVVRINGHAKRNWQADAWMLARTHPKEFAEPAVALSNTVNVDSRPTNIVVIGPEKAAILASRHETIRAKTRELLEHRTNGNGNGKSAPEL